MLYLYHRETRTKVLGPGERYVIRVQGCKKRCPGCINPEGRLEGQNGYWISTEKILAELKNEQGLMGITVSGGEPFLQAHGLAELVKSIKENTQLDIMLYSGYTLAELRAKHDKYINFVLEHSDILVDGEYIEELNNNTIYRGSDNQEIHFLSPRYRDFKDIIYNTHNRDLEFISRNGELFMIGIPEKGFEAKFKRAILERTNFFKEEEK